MFYYCRTPSCLYETNLRCIVSSSYRSNRLGLSHSDPYTLCRGGCLELYYCNRVECVPFVVATHRPFQDVSLCHWPPLPSTRQHPSYGDCLEFKREYYQNCSVLDCVMQCSVSSTLMSAVLTGPTDWACHIGTLTLCVEAVA